MATVPAAPLAVGFGTPFAAQIDFLRQKLRVPTERWDDIASAAHDRAFVVAGAAKADLLADLHQAVIKAAEGGGLPAFRKDFKALRIRIIEPAVAAIIAKASMLVEWKPIRAGSRRVTSLEFRFAANPQGQLDMDEGDLAANKSDATKLVSD